MNRFTVWKVKYQRVAGYVSIATFLIVLYQLVRELYNSPYFPWHPDFAIFVFAALAAAGLAFVVIAELDWHFIFPQEVGIQHTKDPMLFSWALTNAAVLRYFQDDVEMERMLREMYRSVNREPDWDAALASVRAVKR